MGYTHYWTHNLAFSSEEWQDIQRAAREICAISPTPLWYESDDSRPYEIGPDVIHFNGPGDDGHEPFCLDREESGFQFCKTAHKPYDVAVVAILHAVSRIAPNACETSSDGDEEDLAPGVALALRASPWLRAIVLETSIDDDAASG